MIRFSFAATAALLAACSPAPSEERTSPPPAATEETDTVSLASGRTIGADTLSAQIEEAAAAFGIQGGSFALINDGEVVLSHVFGMADTAAGKPVTKATLFEGASMSKPMFGALVVDLASEGIIDLGEPLAEIMPHPDLEDDPRAARFTARHVLTHQTGLPNWRRDNEDGRLDIAFEPGTARRYSGEGYEYLADVLMHALETDDRGLDQAFRERIALPAGATDSFFVQDEERVARKATGYASGEPYSGGTDYAADGFGAAYSIHSTAEDYARLMIGVMNGPSLDEEERAVFFRPQDVPIAEDDPERAMGLTDWALGYAVYETPYGTFYAHGGNNEGFSSFNGMLPERGWGTVLFTNEDQANDFVLTALGILIGEEVSP